MSVELQIVDNFTYIVPVNQGIISWTGTYVRKIIAGTETDACVVQKNIPMLFSLVCIGKFAALWMSCCGMLFPAIDLYFY